MKQSKFFYRLLSVLLACLLFATAVVPNADFAVLGNEYADNYDNLSNEQKQAIIEQKLKEVNAKLAELGKQSSETQQYIDTLDEKIGYLQNKLTLDSQEIDNSKNKISNLKRKYKDNESEIATLKAEIQELTKESAVVQKKFDVSYDEFSERAKALYVSGGSSVIEVLLTCDDISTLFTRLEMVRRVSKHDKELLEGLKEQGERLVSSQEELQAKNEKLESDQVTLAKTQEDLQKNLQSLELQQVDYEKRCKDYRLEKQKSDELLLNLHRQTGNYSEMRNQDQAELDAINAEIEKAAEQYIKEQEEKAEKTTAKTTTKPTAKPTTKPAQSGASSEDKPSTQKTTQKTTTKRTTQASNKLSLTYPIPSQTKITCGYGEYPGHTGVDFSCPTGSKVVAAESGTVIISTDLKNSDGTYRSYGRYIVIAHDKKDSKGNYVFTLYAHNSQRLVSVGDYVTKGQQIAKSGSTGNSTGPHCHFEVRTPTGNYNDCVNPKPYLS